MIKDDAVSKGERTRQAILEAAYKLIIHQGYAATSMRQIADKAGLALGGIYNHFSSKEDVFTAIVIERHPIIQIIPIIQAADGDTVEEFVRNAAQALVDQLKRHPEFVNLMLTEMVEFKGEHMALVFEKMLPTVLQVSERLSHLEGDLRPMPTPVMLRAFAGMFLFYFMTEKLIGPGMPPSMRTDALDHFVEILLHGILKQEPA